MHIRERYPHHQLVTAVQTPIAQSHWNTKQTATGFYYAVRCSSDGTQSAFITFKVPLEAGTYTVDHFGFTGTNRGVTKIDLNPLTADAVAVGTVDLYVASGAAALLTPLAGIVVPKRGTHVVTLTTATKNGASSGYVADLSALGFTRTA